jgi:hypothetical protein
MPDLIVSAAYYLAMPTGAMAALAIFYWFLEIYKVGFNRSIEKTNKIMYVSRRGAIALWLCIIFFVLDRVSKF